MWADSQVSIKPSYSFATTPSLVEQRRGALNSLSGTLKVILLCVPDHRYEQRNEPETDQAELCSWPLVGADCISLAIRSGIYWYYSTVADLRWQSLIAKVETQS